MTKGAFSIFKTYKEVEKKKIKKWRRNKYVQHDGGNRNEIKYIYIK
jgi:hypothetical protein